MAVGAVLAVVSTQLHYPGYLMRFFPVTVMISCLALSACATLGQPDEKVAEPAPKLIEALPEDIGSFEYKGYRYFEDSSNGYTFRYANPKKRRMADVYVYPVSTQNADLDHEDLVMGSTRATIQAIAGAVKQGIYANFNLVGAATRARGFRTVARVEATYLSDNLASYTLVYQTEYDGTLLKIRVTMPDNESNRTSHEWDRFADTMFNKIVVELDDQQAAKLTNKPKSKTKTKNKV